MNSKNKVNPKDINVVYQTLKIIWNCSKRWTAWRFIISIANGVLPLGTLYLIKKIVDEIVTVTAKANGQLHFKFFATYISIWIGLLLATTLITLLLKYISEIHNHKLSDYIQGLVQDKALEVEYRFYDSDNYHDIFHRAQREANRKPQRLLNDLTGLVSNATSLIILSALILATLHWIIGVVFVLIAIPTALVQFKYIERLNKWSILTTQLDRKANYVNQIITFKSFAAENRIFKIGPELRRIFTKAKIELLNGRLKILNIYLRSTIGTSLLEISFLGIVFYYVIMQTNQGLISLGSMVMYFQAFQRGQKTLKDVLSNVNQIFEQKIFLAHLFKFLNLNVVRESYEQRITVEPHFEKVEISNLNFKYPGHNEEVLKGINLSVKKGEVLAIVGENGSGKSTLVKLLCGFYSTRPQEVRLNDRSLCDWNLNDYRQHISVVFQDYCKYNLSTGFNISTKETNWDEDDLERSIKLAGAEDIVSSLPDGYKSKLGLEFKGSSELSMGQYQRIALARALYKKSSLLILDEPTSFIDGISEKLFLDQIKEIAKSRIVIMISHKLSNIVLADRICVLNKGHLVESGTHDELIAKNNYYKKMFEPQLINQ